MRRFSRECVSEHHTLHSTFCRFLSAAFCVVDQTDLQRLTEAYAFCGIRPANPTKQHIREHCRTKVPQPTELLERVESVLKQFFLETDPNGVYLFKPSMLKLWRLQRVHILRGCLSDPEEEDGILYRHGGTVQLNHVKGEGAAVPVWIPVRGTSQQEGFHAHQARWITGNCVSSELFQAQGMMGMARWNFQRLVDLKLPDVKLPAVFDPVLIMQLNVASERVTGHAKYPALQLSHRDTGERFGLQYVEPGCRPVPLDWFKNRSQGADEEGAEEEEADRVVADQPFITPEDNDDVFGEASGVLPQTTVQPVQSTSTQGLPTTPALPITANPRAARTMSIKAGGLLYVLDHSRWTEAMKEVIDGLIGIHQGSKDFLQRVDSDYAGLVQAASRDPNSLLHPTTKQHISQYVKHWAKRTNASTSLNTSPEKLLETQQLWQHLTAESETKSVPVVTIPPAAVNPPGRDPQEAPLTKAAIEDMVRDIVQKQTALQQQQQQQLGKKKTRNCLACGQPKSRYQGDGSSIHLFYQSGEVKYFYCSQRVHKLYAAEGLNDPRMPFEDFADTPFFGKELEAAKLRSAEARRLADLRGKRRAAEQQPTGRLCKFCRKPIKQGPESPVYHSYIYCPTRVLSLYKADGMNAEMTWGEFQQSAFYKAEKKRWAEEKGK
ncbi:uncharacterized protein LOC124489267 [Hypomesus transpacificus]|nr:uncharacterized protein LOC124489264 [Hypomesus transpacificus]XP_046907925.1 uncharacterized protein LOC124489267 [Hypomesus transpacificus]